MEKKKNAVPVTDSIKYLSRNVKSVSTTSSLPTSSSKYLNHPIIRDVVSTWMLRRNGLDWPVEADHGMGLHEALWEVQDQSYIDELFAAERRKNLVFDAWCEARYLANLKNEDYKQFPPGSVGAIINRQIVEFGFQMELGLKDGRQPPVTDYEYYRARGPQIHDYEHILTGGSFDSLGEIVVNFARIANMAKHLSPELANELYVANIFGTLRLIMRAGLHYPACWLVAIDCMDRGIQCGLSSGPYIFGKFEDVLHLPPADAMVKLGIQGAQHVDTGAASAIFREVDTSVSLAAD